MPRRKFSDFELGERIREGKGVTVIAEELGVTKGSVSKRIKQLNLGLSKNVTLHHAGEIVKREINAADQLLKINDTANKLLDRLVTVIEGGDEAPGELLRLEPLLGDKASILEAALKLKAEIRQQLRLQFEVFKGLYDMQAIAEFQREVLEAIGSAAPDLRNQIVARLKERGSIRSAMGWA
jgi:DNA-binding MarR family transcriptional regulator